ncbi:hypothetical protein [Xanthomonas phage X1]|nr:hypothetical protein [Xanthomonas phage X1]
MITKERFEKNIKSYNLTEFQRKWIEDRMEKPDFKEWVWTIGGGMRPQGPIVMPFYTKDGVLHAVRLGKTRVLIEVNSSQLEKN